MNFAAMKRGCVAITAWQSRESLQVLSNYVSWKHGRKQCQQIGAELASIHSADANTQIAGEYDQRAKINGILQISPTVKCSAAIGLTSACIRPPTESGRGRTAPR